MATKATTEYNNATKNTKAPSGGGKGGPKAIKDYTPPANSSSKSPT